MSLSENMDLVALINDRQGWGLPAYHRERYAVFLNASGIDDVEKKTAVVAYYHADNPTVRQLRDPSDTSHVQAWDNVATLVRSVLISRFATQCRDIDDLIQLSLERICLGLAGFKYESRLTTWMHKITINVALEHIRAMSAQRRRPQPESLDHYANISDPHDHIGAAIALRDICAEIVRTLAAGGDPRMLSIFQLKVVDDKKLADISALIRLSPGRISSLLQLAKQLLRDNPSLREEARRLGLDWADPPEFEY